MPMHPDDIVIDPVTLDVTMFIAGTEEQREARVKLITLRDEQQKIISLCDLLAEVREGDEVLQEARRTAQALYDQINAALPPRFRTR